MKYSRECDDCHCCDIPEVTYQPSYPIETVNTTPPSDGHTVQLFGPTDRTAILQSLFDIESFSFGGTLNSWNINSLRSRLDETGNSEKLHPGMHLTLSVTGEQFTAGVRFWPKIPISLSPSGEYDNERLTSINASMLSRHLANHDFSPQQHYRTWVDGDTGPQDDHALPFFGLVFEQGGYLYYGVTIPQVFDQCLRNRSGAATDIYANVTVAGNPHARRLNQTTGEFDFDYSISRSCYPEPAPDVVTRIGFVAGLSTWLDFTTNVFRPGATETIERPVPAGTHRLSVQIAGPSLTSSYREECQCFFRDELTLTANFPSSVSLNTRTEVHGVSVSLTRASGDTEYTGSVSLPVTGSFCVGLGTIDINLSYDPSDDCGELRLTCNCPTPDCVLTVLEADVDDPFTNLDPIDVRFSADVGPVTWTIDLTL